MNIEFYQRNMQLIEKIIKETLDKISEFYIIQEKDCGEFSSLMIRDSEFHMKQYEIETVGNLLIMDCKESKLMQMVSVVITPYFKSLPLLSTDFIYIKEKRNFILEYYDLVEQKNETYKEYLKQFQLLKEKLGMQDMQMGENWYDTIRTVCTAKQTSEEMDERILQNLMDNLKLYIQMEQNLKRMDEKQRRKKWQLTREYSDKLVNNGGVSTDLFKSVLGKEKTKAFFDSVFFGLNCNQ